MFYRSCVLDSVALVYTQLTNLMRLFESEHKIPVLKNIDFVPIALSVGDPDLEKLTEGRLNALDQETFPNYLRTRPEKEVETYLKDGHPKLQANPELLFRNITHTNKAMGQIKDAIGPARNASKQRQMAAAEMVENWTNPSDTAALLAAIGSGTELSAASRSQAQQQQQMLSAPSPAQVAAPQQQQNVRISIR